MSRLRRYRVPGRNGAVLLAFLVGCQSAAAKHERLGDEAYVRGEFADAYAEYALAAGETPSPELRTKTAVAALNAGALNEAATQFALLGQTTPDRAIEAADGLERVAQAASDENNGEALRAALAGLQSVAEGRAIGAFALELARDLGAEPDSPEALDILIYAAAAAPDVDQQDSLMFAYGAALRRLGRCAAAVPLLESLVRRGRVSRMVAQARSWAAGCAVTIGLRELESMEDATATQWFEKAIPLDTGTDVARSARIGMGDALARRGDFQGSIEAHRLAPQGLTQTDSLYALVDSKINSVFDARRAFR